MATDDLSKETTQPVDNIADLDLEGLTPDSLADVPATVGETGLPPSDDEGADVDPMAPVEPATADPQGSDGAPEDGEPQPAETAPARMSDWMKGIGAAGFSMIVHVIGMVVAGMLVLENPIRAEVQTLMATAFEERTPDDPVEIELQEEIEVVTEQTLAVLSSSPAVGVTGPSGTVGTPTLDARLVERAEATTLAVDAPTIGIPDSTGLIQAVPDGEVKGEPRDIVDNYQQAMDRLSQELMWMLDKGPVMAIWLFDQSNSMKDDQQEIRDRLDNVYNQLGIIGTENSNALLTSVASYGGGFNVHTQRPTSNRELIRKAIDAIPIDQSGKEQMCQAVGRAVSVHRRFSGRNRQMALILVTDESGEPDNNVRFLEAAVREAKSANCKIYALGREAVFGYPYAWIRWVHPQTHRTHWLQIDRGPETGFPEQLQIDGFRRRHDAFSSGFGPYEQTRLARETNGIFFMLPSVEPDLVGKENKRRYDLEALRPFLPDLRAREEVFLSRREVPLRSLIWKVISDLNPYNPKSQKVVELRTEFPLQLNEFAEAVAENQAKAKLLLGYMDAAVKELEEGKLLREQEAEPRWQANYDLIRAQLIAYQARIYEYGVGLELFKRNLPEVIKQTPPQQGDRILVHWDMFTRRETLTEESKPYIERASELLKQVMEEYPGSPWAARAEWELNRGYGVYFRADYHRRIREVKNPTPVPKL